MTGASLTIRTNQGWTTRTFDEVRFHGVAILTSYLALKTVQLCGHCICQTLDKPSQTCLDWECAVVTIGTPICLSITAYIRTWLCGSS